MKSVRPHPTTGEPIVEGERQPEPAGEGAQEQAAERDLRERKQPAGDDEGPAQDDRPPPRQPGIMN